MSQEILLDDLVSHYHALQRQGRTVSAEEVCAGHTELLDDFKARLKALAAMEAFLDADTAKGEARPTPTGAGVRGRSANSDDDLLPNVAGYQIEGVLGRGGMGVVYHAWQLSPRRPVALKMILGGHAGPDERARLLREAQAQADLEHPHVVRVYEVGEHAGQPFFSLELVEGGSLDKRIGGTPQPARQAAAWLEPLARALHAAHARGIVHRDLKPSNVLLAADGTPKLTDFGLAKILDVSAAEVHAAGLTPSGAILGTPSYMAPEQAAGKIQEVGPPADVYALGAILYECLTGGPPFKGETLLDTLQQVVSQEPVPPSRLQPKVPRDLETICLKCLEKEPLKRYESAEALADDVGCFKRGEPVHARPVGRIARGWRWCRRNKAVAALLATVVAIVLVALVGLAVGVALLGWKNQQLDLARTEAEAKGEQAARARDRTFQALDAMTSTITGDSLETQVALSAEQKKFLTEVVTYYQEFAGEQGEDEGTRKRIAAAAFRVGLIHYRLGDREASVRAYEQARNSYEKLTAEFPAVPEYRGNLATSHNNLGIILREMGKGLEAEAAHRQALALGEQLAADFPAVPEYRLHLASSHINQGNLLRALGKWHEAKAAYRQALTLSEKLVTEYPAVPEYRLHLAASRNNLGILLREVGKQQEAEAVTRQALALLEQLAADFPAVPHYRQHLAASHRSLGLLLDALGKRSGAEAAHRQALALHAKLAVDFPAVPQYRQHLAASHNLLGNVLLDLGKRQEAEAAHRQALALLEKLTADFPTVPVYRRDLARSHNGLGNLLRALGKLAEAEVAYRQALSLREGLVADFPAVPEYRTELVGSQGNLGSLFSEGGKAAEALVWYDRAIALLKPMVEADPRLTIERHYLRTAHWGRAWTLDKLERPADAAADWERAAALSPVQEKASMLALRARSLVRAGQVERAVAEAADLAKSPDPGVMYALCCVYALAAGKDETNREVHLQCALHLLRRAVAKGYKDAEQLNKDDDLKLLRDHAEFKKLLAELQGK